MNHASATRDFMTSRYLLGELSEHERAEFEEHYFDCAECAADVRAAYAFAANAREVLSVPAVPARPARLSLFGVWNWRVAGFAAVNLAVLASLGYESLWRIPELRRQLLNSETPRIAQEVIVPPAARGAGPVVTVHGSGMLEPVFDLPQKFESYAYEIADASGIQQRLKGDLGAASGDQLKMIIPLAGLKPGNYVLVLRGQQGSASQEIARLRFEVQP